MKKSKISTTAAVFASLISLQIHKQANFSLPKGFTLTAHTGCEGTDDNSIESIRAGAQAKADIVEIDLNYLPDNTPVLSHDKPSKSDLPTLDDAFRLLSQLEVKMNVDVKSTANIPAVVTTAEKYGVQDKIFFTGVEEKDVSAIKAGAPDISYYLNVKVDKKKNNDSSYISELVEKVKASGAVGINMNFRGCSEKLVNSFRTEGLLVSLWTANNKYNMLRCLSFGPDNITTRKPSELRSVINP